MADLSDYQRYVLKQLAKPSCELTATKLQGEWLFSLNGVYADAAEIRVLSELGLVEGETQGEWRVYRLTEKGRRYWAG